MLNKSNLLEALTIIRALLLLSSHSRRQKVREKERGPNCFHNKSTLIRERPPSGGGGTSRNNNLLIKAEVLWLNFFSKAPSLNTLGGN